MRDLPTRSSGELFTVLNDATAQDRAILAQLLRRMPALSPSSRQHLRRISRGDTHSGDACSDARDVALLIRTLEMAGGNSIANVIRGEGVPYAVIVRDVARRVGVKRSAFSAPTVALEGLILARVLGPGSEELLPKQRQDLLHTIGATYQQDLPQAAPLMAVQAAIGLGGRAAYMAAMTAADAVSRQVVGHALQWAGLSAISRSLAALAGPIGWSVTLGWAAAEAAGPAFRITVPCVLYIAQLRQNALHLLGSTDRCELAPDQGCAGSAP